jgi:hypothetical protein
MERKFCGDCGVALWSEPSVLPGKAFLKVSCLTGGGWCGGSRRMWAVEE